jgi:hypothetical protein
MLYRSLSTPDSSEEWKPATRSQLTTSPSAYYDMLPPDFGLPYVYDFMEPRPSSLKRIDERRRKGLSTPENPTWDSLPPARAYNPMNTSVVVLDRLGGDGRICEGFVRGLSPSPRSDIYEEEAMSETSSPPLAGSSMSYGREDFQSLAFRNEQAISKPLRSSMNDADSHSKNLLKALIRKHSKSSAGHFKSHSLMKTDTPSRSNVYAPDFSPTTRMANSLQQQSENVQHLQSRFPSISNEDDGYTYMEPKVLKELAKDLLARVHKRESAFPDMENSHASIETMCKSQNPAEDNAVDLSVPDLVYIYNTPTENIFAGEEIADLTKSELPPPSTPSRKASKSSGFSLVPTRKMKPVRVVVYKKAVKFPSFKCIRRKQAMAAHVNMLAKLYALLTSSSEDLSTQTPQATSETASSAGLNDAVNVTIILALVTHAVMNYTMNYISGNYTPEQLVCQMVREMYTGAIVCVFVHESLSGRLAGVLEAYVEAAEQVGEY